MRIETTSASPFDAGADTVAVGIFADKGVSVGECRPVEELMVRGEASGEFKRLAVAHKDGLRYVAVGLGNAASFDRERARIAAALVMKRAEEIGARRLCWLIPEIDRRWAGAVEGSVLAAYRFDRYRSDSDEAHRLESIVVAGPGDGLASEVSRIVTVARAQNAARDLQNEPPNMLTPKALGEHARELGERHEGLAVELFDRQDIIRMGMGALAAVGQGSEQDQRLIVMRYQGRSAVGPRLGFVGKGVTFDTGGISLKTGPGMLGMKFDMSGAAAVISAVAAVAELGLPVDLIGVVGAVENMPAGGALKPEDVVTAMDGTTVEITNTDAEGRLVLADCVTYAIRQGAERLVDIATLTGGAVVALGSTYAALMSNDDEWCAQVQSAAAGADELIWRLPLHEEYARMLKSESADMLNSPAKRVALPITGAEFVHRFAGKTPWAHIDIAGTASNLGKPYADRGGSGFGVRLLVELARLAAA